MGLASGPQPSFTEQENSQLQIPEGPSPALSSYHLLSFPITTAEPFSSVWSSFLESSWDLQGEGGWKKGLGRNFAHPRLMSLDLSLTALPPMVVVDPLPAEPKTSCPHSEKLGTPSSPPSPVPLFIPDTSLQGDRWHSRQIQLSWTMPGRSGQRLYKAVGDPKPKICL